MLTYKLVNGSKLKPINHFRLIRKVSILGRALTQVWGVGRVCSKAYIYCFSDVISLLKCLQEGTGSSIWLISACRTLWMVP